MRNKIKQLLKKEGGFTLVELLAVLAILALIVGIAIPMIGNVINNSKTSATASQYELVVDAAQLRAIDKSEDFSEITSIDIDQLVNDGYMEWDKELKGKVLTISKGEDGKNEYTLSAK